MNFSFYIVTHIYQLDLKIGNQILTTRNLPDYHVHLKELTLGEIVEILDPFSCLVVIGFNPSHTINFVDFEKNYGNPSNFLYPFIFVDPSKDFLKRDKDRQKSNLKDDDWDAREKRLVQKCTSYQLDKMPQGVGETKTNTRNLVEHSVWHALAFKALNIQTVESFINFFVIFDRIRSVFPFTQIGFNETGIKLVYHILLPFPDSLIDDKEVIVTGAIAFPFKKSKPMIILDEKKFLETGEIRLEFDKNQSFELDFKAGCYNSIYPCHGDHTGDDFEIACIEGAKFAGHEEMVEGYQRRSGKRVEFASEKETEVAYQDPSGILPALCTDQSCSAVANGVAKISEEFRQLKLEAKKKNENLFKDFEKYIQNQNQRLK